MKLSRAGALSQRIAPLERDWPLPSATVRRPLACSHWNPVATSNIDGRGRPEALPADAILLLAGVDFPGQRRLRSAPMRLRSAAGALSHSRIGSRRRCLAA